jgi:cytochrome b involved in lipid metabolism
MGVRPDDSNRVINHSSPEVAKSVFPHERKQQLLSDVAMAKAALSSDKIWWIHGNGYDLSRFVERHPGGKEAILLGRGRDCTALFESYHIFSKDHWYVGIVFVLAICLKEISVI